MSEHEHSRTDGKDTLKLTEWEFANTHLPPVTTVTLYEGSAPVEYLCRRMAMMLEKNPWIASRIVKTNTTDGVLTMTYSRSIDADSAVDQHLFVHETGDVGLSLGMTYEELVG